MTSAPMAYDDQSREDPPAPTRPVVTSSVDDGFSHPTAGMVLHRVLAKSARAFLLNDMGNEFIDAIQRGETVDALSSQMGPRPLWAQSATSALNGTQRRTTETERIHQCRVALRRIRSNLRTFRLAVDPVWGTSLRAEVAWYANQLGKSRDLQVISELVSVSGPEVLDLEQVKRLEAVVAAHLATIATEIDQERGGARRFQLTEQMMVLWDGPAFKAKAQEPAHEVLPLMLHRAWHDLRGAARSARKSSSDANLHKLRIRLKDLRYGCETVALAEGGPARKTAKAAQRLQTKLGDLHDACFSIEWFEDLAKARHDLSEPIGQLLTVQHEAASVARKGWKSELKKVEHQWRQWQG